MESTGTASAVLVAHPAAPSHAVHRIDTHVQLVESGAVFRYVLRGQVSRVRIPPMQPTQRADGLWAHTCFEAFIRAPAAADYYELNFAPSRQWSVYRFKAYREGMSSPDLGASPDISVRRFDDRLEVDATLSLRDLSLQGAPRLQLALTAVVEEENGTLSYWALRHGPGKPDFHSPDGFVLDLAQ